MANRRKGLTVKPTADIFVKPNPEVLNLVKPTEEVKLIIVKPNLAVKPCANCQELKDELVAVATLPTAYIDNREEKLKEQHHKEITKLTERIKELEQPINPTIEL